MADLEGKGKPIATYVTKCLASMMPTTPAPDAVSRYPHEQIQHVEQHPSTHRQAFEPTSESRHFGRRDAAEIFGIPPIEDAVPHPDLVILQRENNAGLTRDEKLANQRQREAEYEAARKEAAQKAKEKEEKEISIVKNGRYQWRFREAASGVVGYRYGVPHQDRKKGQVKIPLGVGL